MILNPERLSSVTPKPLEKPPLGELDPTRYLPADPGRATHVEIAEQIAYEDAYRQAQPIGRALGLAIKKDLENQELREENASLEHEFTHDRLSGLLNREGLNRETKRYIEKGDPFVLFFGDLSDFKELNDKFGHKYGDMFLQWTGGKIQEKLRDPRGDDGDKVTSIADEKDFGDKGARQGGDEFAVLASLIARHPELSTLTEVERCVIIADRIKEAINESSDEFREFLANNPETAGKTFKGVKIDVGWAIWKGQPQEELFEAADANMYQNKRERQAVDGSYRQVATH